LNKTPTKEINMAEPHDKMDECHEKMAPLQPSNSSNIIPKNLEISQFSQFSHGQHQSTSQSPIVTLTNYHQPPVMNPYKKTQTKSSDTIFDLQKYDSIHRYRDPITGYDKIPDGQGGVGYAIPPNLSPSSSTQDSAATLSGRES
jgi:hypothetical protein